MGEVLRDEDEPMYFSESKPTMPMPASLILFLLAGGLLWLIPIEIIRAIW